MIFEYCGNGRGFSTSFGKPIKNSAYVKDLSDGTQLPKTLAIIKIPRHMKDDSKLTKGTATADQAAKAVVYTNVEATNNSLSFSKTELRPVNIRKTARSFLIIKGNK